MIGGVDIHLRTRDSDSAIEVAVRAIRQRWSAAVFENGSTDELYHHFWQIPLGEVEELFVYRDLAAAKLWDEQGAVDSTVNTMIHLISNADSLTVVIDQKDTEMDELIAAIESGLRDEILYIAAEREAA